MGHIKDEYLQKTGGSMATQFSIDFLVVWCLAIWLRSKSIIKSRIDCPLSMSTFWWIWRMICWWATAVTPSISCLNSCARDAVAHNRMIYILREKIRGCCRWYLSSWLSRIKDTASRQCGVASYRWVRYLGTLYMCTTQTKAASVQAILDHLYESCS